MVQAAAEVDSIDALIDQFEEAGHDNGHGDKCWYARDLQALLGYKRWEDFEGVIRKAETACQNAGHDPSGHFREVGSTELAANLFRITQTEEKLRSKGIQGKEAACNAHYEVGLKVRQTMKELSGIMPEDLPVAEDVKKIAAQERKQQRMRAIPAQTRIEQPLAAPKTTDTVEINLTKDLWKYALLIMSVRPNGEISTSDLIEAMPTYVKLSDDHTATNASRKDSKFSQLVRNLKSHKGSKSNFIYQGFAQDIRGGFKITDMGMEFVWSYFKE